MATWKKVVVESGTDTISQTAASITSQGALATLATVGTAQIDDSAVTTAKLDALSVTKAKLATNSVNIAKLYDSNTATAGQYLTADSTPDGFTWVTLPVDTNTTNSSAAFDTSTGVVTITDSASATVTVDLDGKYQDALGSGDVTSSMIGQGTVALSNMANIITDSFIGRDTSSTGVPEVMSVATAKTMMAIENLDNTTDAGKPVSTAQANAIALKALLAGDTSQNFSTNDLAVTGNLTITGTSTIENVTTEVMHLNDSTIVINADKTGEGDIDGGLVVERGTTGTGVKNKSLYWDEGLFAWAFGTSTSQVLGGTYSGNVVAVDLNAAYQSGSTVVPTGSFQFDTANQNLYVRIA